ncbi:hypothetical protein HY633_05115 [Candidatus Uhrbacteria bacterium]|nr:hypothetical protein [Candidatus Uhrbacteria bacterium]
MDFIEASKKEGKTLYQIRIDLLTAGWSVDDVDFHIRYVREGLTPETASAPSIQVRPGGGKPPGWLLVLIACVLIVGGLVSGGFAARLFGFLLMVLLWLWIIFWGGAARLSGSFGMGALAGYSGATRWSVDTVKFFAWLALLSGVGQFIFFAAIATPKWNAFIWPDQETRKLMGPNLAYFYEKEFSSFDQCWNWAVPQARLSPGQVLVCGRDCKRSGLMYSCKEFR